ncbi:MAG: nucleotidyl transferase AbiEii/AbiGii toxin family protein [Bacteroidales bacterium]|jgi:hypothetical protein|nr:nucleotidyl transferase AbiEii/AbiGii toxin family protein [Bacteroidales bacterium]
MSERTFNDFVLVGGTALSLQLGHRISEDIDLFPYVEYGTLDLEAIRNSLKRLFPFTEDVDEINRRQIGYTVYIGKSKEQQIKLDMFYMGPLITPVVEADGIRLASLQDIAAMKLLAIVGSKRKKEFWDIHTLLEKFSLQEIIDFGLSRYPYSFEKEDILNALETPYEDIVDYPVTDLRGNYWELIVEDLHDYVKEYKTQNL